MGLDGGRAVARGYLQCCPGALGLGLIHIPRCSWKEKGANRRHITEANRFPI